MKKLLLIASLIAAASAQAALTEPDHAALSSFKNYALNGGAENGKAGWSVSGTSSALTNLAVDTTNKYDGNAGFAWTPANADNYLSNAAVTITSSQGLSGQNCSAIVYTKTAVATHALEAYDGTNVLATVTIPISTGYTPVTLNWPCSASGTNRVRFNAGSTTAIYFDSLKWGDARGLNLSQVSQASFFGSLQFSGPSCVQNVTAASLSDFATNANCTSRITAGNATSATTLPEINFPSLPPGEYLITLTGRISGDGASACNFVLTDVSNNVLSSLWNSAATAGAGEAGGTLVARYSTATAVTNAAFKLRASRESGAGNCRYVADSTNRALNFTVYRFPTTAQTAYTPAQYPVSPTIQKFTSGSGTYTTPMGVKYIRVRMVGGGGGGGGSGTSGAGGGGTGGPTTFGPSLLVANGGAQISGGSASLGTGPIGTALTGGSATGGLSSAASVFFNGPSGASSPFGGAGGGGQGNGAGNAAVANSGSGGGAAGSPNPGSPGAGGGAGGYIDAIISAPLASYTYAVGAGGSAGSAGAGGGQVGGAGGSGYIEVTEYYPTENAPLLVGSVTSNTSGTERVERAMFGGSTAASNTATDNCTGSPCTVHRQSGSWVSSVTRSSAGFYTLNIVSGLFSDKPSCTCRSLLSGTGPAQCGSGGLTTTTSMSITSATLAGTLTDGQIEVICMGPR